MNAPAPSSDPPAVSVLIATHNRAAMLLRAIDSVLAQTFTNLELIVVSDGSTDETAAMVAGVRDPRVRFLAHPRNLGAPAARNTAFAASRGRYIAFLDDDDEFLPDKLAVQVPFLEQAPAEVGMIYGWSEYWEGERLVSVHQPALRGRVLVDLLETQVLGALPTVLVRREALEAIGPWDPAYRRGTDGNYWRRLSRQYAVDVLPRVVARVHIGHADRTSQDTPENLRQVTLALEWRLREFAPEFAAHPVIGARVLSTLGKTHARLGQAREAWRCAGRVWRCRGAPAGTRLRLVAGILRALWRGRAHAAAR